MEVGGKGQTERKIKESERGGGLGKEEREK